MNRLGISIQREEERSRKLERKAETRVLPLGAYKVQTPIE